MTKDRQVLFDFREEIPQFVFRELPKDKYFSHPVRREIIKILKKGINEKSPDGKHSIRYALNVREIRELLRKIYEKPPNITALYFHLDILTELEMIKEVATLNEGPHGRNKTRYFGRVSRHLIVYNIDEECENFKLQFKEFENFAKLIGLNTPENLPSIGEKFSDLRKEKYQILGKWLIDQEEIIEKKNLDLNLLFDFLKNVVSIHPEYLKLFGDLFKLIQKNIDGI